MQHVPKTRGLCHKVKLTLLGLRYAHMPQSTASTPEIDTTSPPSKPLGRFEALHRGGPLRLLCTPHRTLRSSQGERHAQPLLRPPARQADAHHAGHANQQTPPPRRARTPRQAGQPTTQGAHTPRNAPPPRPGRAAPEQAPQARKCAKPRRGRTAFRPSKRIARRFVTSDRVRYPLTAPD